MRVFLFVAGDGAILVLEAAPEDCGDGNEPHDTIPSPPPEFDSDPDAAEIFGALCALAWHRAPAGQA